MSPRFALLVPLKVPGEAKTRLGLSAGRRRELMRAFAADAVRSALETRLVGTVCVVTAAPGDRPTGTEWLPDEGAGDLNRTLVCAVARLRSSEPELPVAAMCADLPCLLAEELDEALGFASSGQWFTADADGTGTSLLVSAPGARFTPCFGPGSAAAHLAAGAVPVAALVPTLRRDVDTETDLLAAQALGLGPHTAALLEAPPD